jgi:hypothetical protein
MKIGWIGWVVIASCAVPILWVVAYTVGHASSLGKMHAVRFFEAVRLKLKGLA